MTPVQLHNIISKEEVLFKMIYHLIEYYINLPSTDLLNYTGKLESRDFYYEIRECSLHFNTALQR